MKIPFIYNLTSVLPETEEAAKHTYAGMAHFATTGPADKTCRECSFWGLSNYFRRTEGRLDPRRCVKYAQLMHGHQAAPVPYHAKSCKFFNQRASVPEILK